MTDESKDLQVLQSLVTQAVTEGLMKGMEESELFKNLAGLVQELQARVESLQREITELKKKAPPLEKGV